MAALLKVFASYVRENSVKRRGSTAGFREMNYCPETVLVHSAFLLAETVQKLDEIEKDKCSQVVKIVTGTVREITREVLHENTRKLRQIEVREIEFKIHSWVFYSLLKRSDCHDLGESLEEEDYFDSFPPLPQFGINFYLELVQELEWGELLVECLFAVGLTNITALLKDIIRCLIQEPRYKDLSLFLCLFNSLLIPGEQSLFPEKEKMEIGDTTRIQSWSLLLLQGVTSLTKNYACWPEAQMDIIKGVIDLMFTALIDFNLRELDNQRWSQDNVSITPVSMELDHDNHEKINTHDINNCDVSYEATACIDMLCQVIVKDWRETFHWISSEKANGSSGELDWSSWNTLHKWLIKLYAVVCWLASHSHNSRIVEAALTLQPGLTQYIMKYCTNKELLWIDGFKKGELMALSKCHIEEEFNPPTESVDLLLFQPETSEEQFQFYLHRVNGRLEGYKECFDWLLNAEEFHGESEWLQCMRNNAVQLSDIELAFKMIDIICMQRQLLSCDEGSTDNTYRGVREILLSLYSTFPSATQEQIIEYAFLMGHTLENPEENSLFFHPYFVEQERADLQQELVMIFNKIIDISSEDELQSAAKDMARVALISPHLALTKAVYEGVKSAGHSKSICCVLQKFRAVCRLRCSESLSSTTLLSKTVNSVITSVSSRQQENNLLNMLTLFLSSGPSEPSPLLSVQEFIEAAVLPFLNNTTMQGNIPTVLSLKLLNMAMATVSVPIDDHFLKKHLVPIIFCLCELLNESILFWDGLVPVNSLSEREELKELVLKALDMEVKLCCDMVQTNSSFSRAIEWLFRRLKSGFDWTVPLHLQHFFSTSCIKYKLSVPHCLLSVCEDLGEEWVADKDLDYGPEDVFTVLFEYCRVSETALQRILESFIPSKLTDRFEDIKKPVVTSLVQILPHSTWKEWKRILHICRHLIWKNILKVSVTEDIPSLDASEDHQGVCQLSVLLVNVMEVFCSPLCSSWATLYLWIYVIKHYITAVKEMVDQTTDPPTAALVFAHVCRVMTFVPPDCTDQLFVLCLDFVSRPLVSCTSERLRMAVNSLSSEVYKAALIQKLSQNM